MLSVKGLLAAASCIMMPVACSWAQVSCSETLHLKIVDKQHEAIINTLVKVDSQQDYTDDNGYVQFGAVCPGKVHIHIEPFDGKIWEADIDFVRSDDTVTLVSSHTGITLDDVEIEGHRQAVQTANASHTLQGSDLQKMQGQSLAQQMQSIPGVRMLQTGGTIAKPVVNGMYGNRVLILNNGVRQQGQQWGAEHAPEIDPYIANRITVVKGAESVRYGSDAIGGVVIVDPPTLPDDQKLHAGLSLMGASNGRQGAAAANISGNFSKLPALAFRMQGTARQSGNLKTADYFLNNTGSKEYNYSAALGYTKEHFSADIFYSRFNTNLGILKDFADADFTYDINAPRQRVTHDLLKIGVHQHFNDYWHLNAQYAFQYDNRQEYDVRRNNRTSLPTLNLKLHTQTADLSVDYFNGRQWNLTLGASGMYQGNASVPGSMVTPLIPDYILKTAGSYAVARFQQSKYTLEAGLRYDYLSLNAAGYDNQGALYGGQHHYNALNANVGVVWYIRDGLSLRSNAGTAWRPPSVNELYSNGVHHGALSYELGDSTLRVEKSYKWVTTLQYNAVSWLQLNWDVYAQYFNGYIYLNPMDSIVANIRGSFPYFAYQQTDARFLGSDLSAQFDFAKQFEYRITASIIRAKDVRAGRFLPMIPSDKISQGLQWNIPAGDKRFQNTFIAVSHEYIARQNHYESNSDYAAPPPAYHLWGIGAGTELSWKQQSVKLFLTIDNITNQQYRDYMNRYRYYVDDMGRNIQLRIIYSI